VIESFLPLASRPDADFYIILDLLLPYILVQGLRAETLLKRFLLCMDNRIQECVG
jgi:hypothetical protein